MKGKGFYWLKYMKVEGNQLFWYGKKAQRGLQIYFKAVKKSKKHSDFVIYSYFKWSAFTLVNRDAKF